MLRNNGSDPNAIAISAPLNATHFETSEPSITLCFWVRTAPTDNLGTILSYGIGGRLLL